MSIGIRDNREMGLNIGCRQGGSYMQLLWNISDVDSDSVTTIQAKVILSHTKPLSTRWEDSKQLMSVEQ